MMHKNILLALGIILFTVSLKAQQTKEIKVTSFDEVKFEGSAQWVLIPSDEERVLIESENTDVFDFVSIDQKGDLLTISTTDKNKNITKLFKSVTIKVYFKSISSVSLSGVGNVNTESQFKVSSLTAILRGTGNMDLEVDCNEFIGNMYGTGVLTVSGTSDKSIVRVEGVGGFDGSEFETSDMNVTVSGVGGAKVYATDILTATLNGVGSIKYDGDPGTTNLNTNGIGAIKKADF
ncbi:MAG: DUF2807 domain-containing protein [Bacteroidetes bacterium]|nr:DUF2807 domain-containing protein [Bacteroidota bacterium]